MDAASPQQSGPGYLGPTSYAAAFTGEHQAPVDPDLQPTTDFNNIEDISFYQHPLSKAVRMQITSTILRSFRHYSTILWATKAYCVLAQANYLVEAVGVNAVEALQETVDKYDLINKVPDPELVTMVLENTRQSLDIPSSTQPQDVHKLCTGPNLRLEIIAWILAEAGRAAVFGLDTVQPGMKQVRYRFIHEMLRSSASCLLLCTHISPANDMTIWAHFAHLLLVSQLCGQTGMYIAADFPFPTPYLG
jgi:hypothetical protein